MIVKQAQASTLLDEVINEFGEGMAALRFDSFFSVKSFQGAHAALTKQVQELNEFSESRASATGREQFRQMWVAVPALDLRYVPAEAIAIGAKGAQDDQLIETLVDHLDHQNLWILVSAYELFEKYCKDLFGTLGYLDRNLWQRSDFGDIEITEIAKQKHEWFREQVRKTIAKHNVDGIMRRFCERLPRFQEHLDNAKPEHESWVRIIGLFRHHIVHMRGRVAAEKRIAIFEKTTGLSFQSQEQQKFLNSVTSRFMVLDAGEYRLTGIDRSKLMPPYQDVEKPTKDLMGFLVNYACLCYTCAITHFGKMPFWER